MLLYVLGGLIAFVLVVLAIVMFFRCRLCWRLHIAIFLFIIRQFRQILELMIRKIMYSYLV